MKNILPALPASVLCRLVVPTPAFRPARLVAAAFLFLAGLFLAISPSQAADVPGAALAFDGVNDRVTLTNISPISSGVPGQYTAEVWLKLDSYAGGLGMMIYGDERNGNQGILLQIDGSGRPWTFHPGVGIVTAAAVVPLNTWTHLAFVQDTNRLALYVNGVYAQTLLNTPNLHQETSDREYLGAFTADYSSFSRFLHGRLDEVRVWSRALTDNEIQTQWNCELAGTESGLVAYYKCNQGVAGGNNASLTTLEDATTNHNHGALTNFALNGTTSNWIEPGGVVTGTSCAEIAVQQPVGTDLPDSGSRAFGTVALGSSKSLSFTIVNTGLANLTGLDITIDGLNAADFSVTAPSSTVVPGASATFTVRFAPTSAGARTAALHIANNDSDENPFDLTLTGVGVPAFIVPTPATPVLDHFDQLGRIRTGSNQFDGATAGGQAYTIVGGGNDIYARSDEFAFAYHELAGDFDLRVQVTELERSGFFSKAGLMVRESLAEDSRRVMQGVTPATGANTTEFLWRTGLNDEANSGGGDGGNGGENGGAHYIYGAPPSFPNAWVRLVRTGSVFEGFRGTDGINWTSIASRDSALWQGGAMPGKLYVGLAVSRHPTADTNLTCRAVFANYRESSLRFCVGEVSSLGYPNTVFVTYNRPVGPSALVAGNYTLAGAGVTINSVTAGSRPEIVVLTVTPLMEGTNYTLSAHAAVRDALGNALDAGCRTGSFVHGAGFEARKIHLQHNRIDGPDVSFYLESRAYAYGIGAASCGRPGFETNTLFEDLIPDDGNTNWYSTRIFGVLSNSTGAALSARFACSSDDQGILFLSSDDQPAHKVEIAREPEWNNSRQYAAPDRRGPGLRNLSFPQPLAANSRHYLEYTYSEAYGGNNGSAAWITGSGNDFTNNQVPISETNFIPSRFAYGQIFYNLGQVVLLTGPANVTVPTGIPATFSMTLDGTPPYEFSWKTNGTLVPGANSATLTLPNLTQGTTPVTVCVSNRLGGVCASATLTSLPLSIVRSPISTNDVVLSWPVTPGVVLLESPSLSPAIWTTASRGGSNPITFSATSPSRFYRLFLLPVQPSPVPNMIFISPGTFTMGSPTDEVGRFGDEGPQTVVTLTRGFWMGKYEVTQWEYLAVIGSNPSYFTGDLKRPVEWVSWNDATNYCARLTTRERTAGLLPSGWAYRLPTEAEWEYAARAGTTTRFSYGDDPGYTSLANYAWYSANSSSTTHPVGQKLANPWGLSDMAGNVFEWCQDWYGNYPGGSVTDPQGPGTGSLRVVRSGSWGGPAGRCRSALRGLGSPDDGYSFVGFRVVLAPGQP